MEYKYCDKQNFEDLSSGRVLYGNSGIPNFPVRLINEIYRRCLSYSPKDNDIRLYDCCCGGGYSLTVLGFCNQDTISAIYGSDIDDKMTAFAMKNCSLLTEKGLNKRIDELRELYQMYHKPSHEEGLKSALKLKESLKGDIKTVIFKADATREISLPDTIDIIICDIPYGNMVEWQGYGNAFAEMINQICRLAGKDTIIAVIMDKKQKVDDKRLKRLEKNNVGKRKFEIYALREKQDESNARE